MNPFYVLLCCSYLAWWSLDYLCEKLDLTCKRNHISSFFYFSPFLLLHHLNSLLAFIHISLILMTFWFSGSALNPERPPPPSRVRYGFNFFFMQTLLVESAREFDGWEAAQPWTSRDLKERHSLMRDLTKRSIFSFAVTKRQPSCCRIHGSIITTPCNRKSRWAWRTRARVYLKSPTTITLTSQSTRSIIRCINFISHTITCTAITSTTPHPSAILITITT